MFACFRETEKLQCFRKTVGVFVKSHSFSLSCPVELDALSDKYLTNKQSSSRTLDRSFTKCKYVYFSLFMCKSGACV